MKNRNIYTTMRLHYVLCISVISLLFSSCQKEEALPSTPIIGLGGDDWEPTEIDNYLYQNFVLPYNIEVKYKWDPYEVNFNKALVPPKEEKVIPLMETIKDIWIDPYKQVAGIDFLRKYAILKCVLVGSADYQSNGSFTLGTAEGGNKIVLYLVNDFLRSQKDKVKEMMHVIHHEYAHILHQHKAIPNEFRNISNNWYTATWFNTHDEVAQSQGLVTAYAKASLQEDFVETIASLLVEGQEAFDLLIANNPSQEITFRRKEEIVVKYYKDLGVDFRALQQLVKEGINN